MKQEPTTDLSVAWFPIRNGDKPRWMVRGALNLVYDATAPCWLQFMVCEIHLMTQVTSSADLVLETKGREADSASGATKLKWQ